MKIRECHPAGSQLLTFSSLGYYNNTRVRSIKPANKQEKMGDLQGAVEKEYRRPICGVET